MAKLMILGLDGVPWKLIERWVYEWNLENFKRIIKNGVYGKLISTIPCNTCPALPSFYTGKNPGNLGIFDFIKPDGSLVTHKDLKSPAFWDYLSQYGFMSCIAGTRMTYPVPEVRGVFITGILVAGEDKRYLVYPKELWDEVKDFYPSKKERELYEKMTKNPEKNVGRIYEFCRRNLIRQVEIFNKIAKKDDYDFKFLWYGDTDTLLHYSIKNEYYIKKLMDEIDKVLGGIDDENIFMVSDHGFGATAEYNFHLNEWLYKEGYLKMKWGLVGRYVYVAGYRIAESIIPDSVKKKILNILRDVVSNQNENKSFSKDLVITPLDNIPGVDWNKTIAHVTTDKCWGIRIIKENLDRDYEEVREEIIQKLKQLEFKGKRVIKDAWRGEEIYWGEYQDQIPDIIFLKEDMFRVRPSLVGKMVTKIKRKYGNYVGDHESAREGIFIAYGEDIKNTGEYIGEVQIYDLAPTILHMYGIPIPEDMDGRVLKEMFREGSDPYIREIEYQEVDKEKELISSKIRELRKLGKI